MIQNLIKLVSRAPNYYRAFGLLTGIRLLLKIEGRGARSSDRILKLFVPGDPHPIYLRDRISDRSIFWQVMVQQQYQLNMFPHFHVIQKKYAAFVSENKTPIIIDGGANIGLSARFLARIFPLAKIAAIEPSTENYGMILRNISPLTDRITPIKGGVWPVDSNLKIENLNVGDTSFRVVEVDDNDENSIKGYSIATLLKKMNSSEAFIVKLDIEGSQDPLFRKNIKWLNDTHLIFLELDDWLIPWHGTSMSFFSASAKIPSDYLISGEDVIWINHSIQQ